MTTSEVLSPKTHYHFEDGCIVGSPIRRETAHHPDCERHAEPECRRWRSAGLLT